MNPQEDKREKIKEDLNIRIRINYIKFEDLVL
jgi:hypothetical protein